LCEDFLPCSDFHLEKKFTKTHKHLIGFAIFSSKSQAFDCLRYFHFATE
jgi:hypothetical protein